MHAAVSSKHGRHMLQQQHNTADLLLNPHGAMAVAVVMLPAVCAAAHHSF